MAKVWIFALLVASACAAPQLALDQLAQLEDEEPFNANPQYTYAYQVSDDNEQTYISHEEARDDDTVTGKYSYVDPLGSLIVVTYTAGPMGYTEQREVQSNFVEIRRRTSAPRVAEPAPAPIARPAPVVRPAPVREVVQQIRPVVQQVVQEQSASSSGENDDSLVARIIAQLTPFIRNTVSTSLGSSGSSSASGSSTTTTTTTTAARPVAVAAPAPAVRRVVVPVQQAVPAVTRETVTTTQVNGGSSSLQNIFGVQGENNVRVNTPDFNFAYDLTN